MVDAPKAFESVFELLDASTEHVKSAENDGMFPQHREVALLQAVLAQALATQAVAVAIVQSAVYRGERNALFGESRCKGYDNK